MSHDKELLQKLYQRAMAICHPDRLHHVPERLRPFLETKAKELNAARDADSFARVRKIAEELGVKDIPPMPESESAPQKPQAKPQQHARKGRAEKQQHSRKSQESAARGFSWREFWREFNRTPSDQEATISSMRFILVVIFALIGFIIVDDNSAAGNTELGAVILGGMVGFTVGKYLAHYFPKVMVVLFYILSVLFWGALLAMYLESK